MLLTVFLSSSISPLAGTSICLDKSPAATALVTMATDRIRGEVIDGGSKFFPCAFYTLDVGLTAEKAFSFE